MRPGGFLFQHVCPLRLRAGLAVVLALVLALAPVTLQAARSAPVDPVVTAAAPPDATPDPAPIGELGQCGCLAGYVAATAAATTVPRSPRSVSFALAAEGAAPDFAQSPPMRPPRA